MGLTRRDVYEATTLALGSGLTISFQARLEAANERTPKPGYSNAAVLEWWYGFEGLDSFLAGVGELSRGNPSSFAIESGLESDEYRTAAFEKRATFAARLLQQAPPSQLGGGAHRGLTDAINVMIAQLGEDELADVLRYAAALVAAR